MTEAKVPILFVDDEPDILEGLRRSLRRQRRRWDTNFAAGGALALQRLGESPATVVVTDMRMPEMDGAQFLREVRERRPQSLRVVLSGQANEELVSDAIPVTHRWLHKPCERDDLIATLESLIEVHARLVDTSWAVEIGKTAFLPIAPAVHETLGRGLDEGDSAAVEACVEADAGLAAKVLQLACSIRAGDRDASISISEAVRRLSGDLLGVVHSGVSVVSQLPGGGGVDLLMHRAQQMPADVQRWVGSEHGEVARVAGTLADIGTLVVAAHRPEEWAGMLAQGGELAELERSAWGIDRAGIGASLLQLWGLPRAVWTAVQFQDRPDEAPPEFRRLAEGVHLGSRAAAVRLLRQGVEHRAFPRELHPSVAEELHARRKSVRTKG